MRRQIAWSTCAWSGSSSTAPPTSKPTIGYSPNSNSLDASDSPVASEGNTQSISLWGPPGLPITLPSCARDKHRFSEGPREAEDVFGDVREDEVRGDRGDLVETRLAELALHVVLGVEAVAAEGLQGGVGCLPGGVGGQELRQVRLGSARLSPIEQGGRLLHHERGGLDVRVSPRYGELDALILPDRAPEHLALAGAYGGLL